MLTSFEIEDEEAYLAARALLVRRSGRWAAANGLTLDPGLAGAMLDSRHFSSDGRLGYWTPVQVRRALLEWLPEKVAAPDDDLLQAPGTLRALLRYLDASGLRDPRGATTEENESAIDAIDAEFAAAVGDQELYGVAKLIATAARRHGVDVTSPVAMQEFLTDIEAGRAGLDERLLERALERQVERPGPGEARTFAQLPVWLPPEAELRQAAEASRVVAQLRSFTEWAGQEGRTLTAAGYLRPADARELVRVLGTGEEKLKFRSAAELPGLNLIVTWARTARLVRRQGGRLHQVAKARRVLADAEALWQRAFDVLSDPAVATAVCPPRWTDETPSPVAQLYELVVPDVLATIYSMEDPVPVVRIAESVWVLVQENFDLSAFSSLGLAAVRGRAEIDLAGIFDAFEALGAIDSVHGVADGIFSSDLDEAAELPDGAGRPFTGESAARLRERLAVPGRLVSLTPIGTRAMRQRLLAEGREAGLVGELAGASAAELLGTISEHYTPESGAAEISIWRAARDGALEPLLDAVRGSEFITRRAAMLNVLSHALPEWDDLIDRLSQDPELWPIVLLARRSELVPEQVSAEDSFMIMVGTALELLELGGPEAVLASLRSMPRAQRNNIITEVAGSGFPAPQTLEDFASLVAKPLRSVPPPPHERPRLRVIRNDQHRHTRKNPRRR